MGSVLDMLLEGVMHYRSRGYEKKREKKIPRPQSSQGYNAQKTTCLQNCDAPRDQPAALAPSTDFPLKEEQVGFKKTGSIGNYVLLGEGVLIFPSTGRQMLV